MSIGIEKTRRCLGILPTVKSLPNSLSIYFLFLPEINQDIIIFFLLWQQDYGDILFPDSLRMSMVSGYSPQTRLLLISASQLASLPACQL
jgi:hypothetical protein